MSKSHIKNLQKRFMAKKLNLDIMTSGDETVSDIWIISNNWNNNVKQFIEYIFEYLK